MRKGFTLVEVLLIIATVPLFMVLMSRLFSTLLLETPRIWKNVQQNTTMLNMLSQMQQDIDNATELPQSKGGFSSDDKLLLIRQEDRLIGYEIADERISRRILSDNQTEPSEPRAWLIPDAKIEWNILRTNDIGHCLEVHSHIGSQYENRFKH